LLITYKIPVTHSPVFINYCPWTRWKPLLLNFIIMEKMWEWVEKPSHPMLDFTTKYCATSLTWGHSNSLLYSRYVLCICCCKLYFPLHSITHTQMWKSTLQTLNNDLRYLMAYMVLKLSGIFYKLYSYILKYDTLFTTVSARKSVFFFTSTDNTAYYITKY
jgi:hypothetical protein